MKKGRLKVTPILLAVNIILIVSMAVYYIYRAVYYYIEENGKEVGTDTIIFSDYLSSKQSYVDTTKGLVYDGEANVYTYKGEVKDNYLSYSGIMFRIIGIDNENNVRAVSDKNVTIMYSGLEKGYENSYLRKWFNINEEEENTGIFMKSLYDSDALLAHSYICLDVIQDTSNITCEENINADYVSMLSLYDYSMAGGEKSFLNNGENYYLSTINESGANYIVNSSGSVSLNSVTTRVYGVRPVITISADAQLLDGKGTESDPYIIEKHDKKVLSDTYINDYIKLSGNNYKVISASEDRVLVALDGIIKDEEEAVLRNFGSNNKFSTSKGTVGNYLNNDFYSTIEEADFILDSQWYIGKNSMSNLDYTVKYDSKVSAKIGMLSLGDMYIHDIKNVFTLSRGIESDNIIDVINENGNLFGDLVSSKYNVRPAFYLDGSLVITSGSGKADDAYVLGGSLDGEEETEE